MNANPPTDRHVYCVSEIRDGVVQRIHGYHASLQGAFGYCETEERKRQPTIISSSRFELFAAPDGDRWLIHQFYGPDDDWPETSDFVISRHEVTSDAASPAAPSSPPDQTLRDRIAAAIAADDGHPWDTLCADTQHHYLDNADAVLSVLPPATDAPAAECSAMHGRFDDGRACIRAAQHDGDHIDERGFHWSDTVAVYPVADGTVHTARPSALRRLAAEAPQPECTASRSGSCLREAESETACDTDAGECVHGGRPGAEAPQPDTETQADVFTAADLVAALRAAGKERDKIHAKELDGLRAAEDPARIDRMRPEFTDNASVESIDIQLQRSRAQERRWHLRTEWLISLRADRVAQKARGEWPAAAPAAAGPGRAADTRDDEAQGAEQ